MGRFAIICPKCNQYVTAYNGFKGIFKSKITCNCGNVINVKEQRMTSAICPSCGNSVLYDQGKSIPTCPVCRKKIEPGADHRLISIECPECGVGLSVTEGTQKYTCPICNNHIDVQREIAKKQYSSQGLVSEIKYEGDNNTFIWKHPVEDFSIGTQLIVHESQEAIFFKDGEALDLFGPGRHTLETQNVPLMNSVYPLPTPDSKETFHSEIYFVNTTTIMGVKWGTDTKVRIFDPLSGMHISIGAGGEFNIKVNDTRRLLLKSIGTTNGLIVDSKDSSKNNYDSKPGEFKKYFRSLIVTKVKNYLANVIKEEQISILEIDAQTERLSEALKDKINSGLEEYGLIMPEFYIMRFVTPEDDPSDPAHKDYVAMKESYAKIYLNRREEEVKKVKAEAAWERMTVEAQAKAQMKIIDAQGDAEALKIQKAAEAEVYRMKAEAEAEEMHMKAYTYQQETARKVGTEAVKNSGIGNTGSLGDVAGLGIAIGTMGGVIDMTREAMQPISRTANQMGQSINNMISDGWDCLCGQRGLTGKFCPECGKEKTKPVEMESDWDCPQCGEKGLTGKFCPECGTKRPVTQRVEVWDCPCGQKSLIGKFCPECGRKRED